MTNGCVSIDRILSRLDAFLHKNDYESAEKHLLYWIGEAEKYNDHRVELLARNELMGLYRKLSREAEALDCVKVTLSRIELLGISHQVGAATAFLNCATVYKAFGKAELAMPLFESARLIYERELDKNDSRMGGLYNNMALALVDLGRFDEANELYRAAIDVMKQNEGGELEVAITYLNMATALESEKGLLDADEAINGYLSIAQNILDGYENRDGYYAFVCEKCASVFGYYGWFFYNKELEERARTIYEGN